MFGSHKSFPPILGGHFSVSQSLFLPRLEMKLSWNIIVVALLLCLFAPSRKAAARRENRQFNGLSLFNVVKFENTACEANGNNNGTCYTAGECEDLGGEAEGSCASGLGVCCVFNYGCGEQSNLNNTYFKSSGQQEGNCHYKVCPVQTLLNSTLIP